MNAVRPEQPRAAAFVSELEVDPATRIVRNRESARREFKVGFDRLELPRYAKTMAAFSNAQGGVMFFGVRAKPREIVGCDPGVFPDEAEIATRLQNWFDPAPRFEIIEVEVLSLRLVVIAVEESEQKPVICKLTVTGKKPKKNPKVPDELEAVLTEGDIYYRYTGKTDRIRFADLQSIFRQRDQRIYEAVMSSVAAIRRIGAERIGIVDRTTAGRPGAATKMYVPRDAVGSLNLIDRGRFVEAENEGERAFYVVGEVELAYANVVDDGDRLLPSKVVRTLQPDAARLLHPSVRLAEGHLAEFAKARGLRTSRQALDDRFCKRDDLSDRWFYRQAFVDLVRQAMRQDPLKAAKDLRVSVAARAEVEERVRATLVQSPSAGRSVMEKVKGNTRDVTT